MERKQRKRYCFQNNWGGGRKRGGGASEKACHIFRQLLCSPGFYSDSSFTSKSNHLCFAFQKSAGEEVLKAQQATAIKSAASSQEKKRKAEEVLNNDFLESNHGPSDSTCFSEAEGADSG